MSLPSDDERREEAQSQRSFPCRRDYRFSSKALLPQPGGFEGLGAMAEELHLAHSSIPERDDFARHAVERAIRSAR